MNRAFQWRLYSQRLEHNLTQEELGRKCGWPGTLISQYECGRKLPSFDSLITLADALDCSVDWLMGRIEKSTPVD